MPVYLLDVGVTKRWLLVSHGILREGRVREHLDPFLLRVIISILKSTGDSLANIINSFLDVFQGTIKPVTEVSKGGIVGDSSLNVTEDVLLLFSADYLGADGKSQNCHGSQRFHWSHAYAGR